MQGCHVLTYIQLMQCYVDKAKEREREKESDSERKRENETRETKMKKSNKKGGKKED